MENLQQTDPVGNKDQKGKKNIKYTKGQVLLMKNLVKAYKASSANVSEACIKCSTSRPTFYKFYNNCPDFKQQIDDVGEDELDFAEGQLKLLMKGQFTYIPKLDKDGNRIIKVRKGKKVPARDENGDVIPNEYEYEVERDAMGVPLRNYHTPIDNASVIFKLKTHGKKRDYTYRTEITGAEGSPLGGFKIKINRKDKK